MRRYLLVYRPGDSDLAAAAIYGALCQRFGSWRVLRVGDQQALTRVAESGDQLRRQCAALVVVIGRRWSAPASQGGSGGIVEAADPHRQLLERALQTSSLLVLPVLVDGAAMPSPLQLPPALADLAYRNAAVIPPGPAFPLAVARVIRGIVTWVPYQERVHYPHYAVWSAVLYLIYILGFYAAIVAIGGPAGYYQFAHTHTITQNAVIVETPICLVSIAGLVLSVVVLVRAIKVRSWWWALGLMLACWVGPVMPLLFGLFGRVEPPVRVPAAQVQRAVAPLPGARPR